jgi:small RNA 2'-O-methyltransferase
LHDERLETVLAALLASGARTVLDLGCGSGALLRRLLAEAQFTRIVGVDSSARALLRADHDLQAMGDDPGRCSLEHASFADPEERWVGFDAAAMVETLEHVAPAQLSCVERAVFAVLRPTIVVITTPNREYNVRYGLAEGEFRHPDHKFEWGRSRFRAWANGVGERNGYQVAFHDVGAIDALLGSPTQMGIFRRTSGCSIPSACGETDAGARRGTGEA